MSSPLPVNLQGMFDWAVNMCNAANVGYSQTYRNYETVNGITYFDCSSFTFFALWLGGGFDVGHFGYSTNLSDYQNRLENAWIVTEMINCLQAAGWTRMDPEQVQWLPGDILAKTRTHTEICYSNSPLQTMGARNPNLPLADQVSIHGASTGYYDVLLRYNAGPGPHPQPTQPMPIWLLKRAIEIQKGGIFV